MMTERAKILGLSLVALLLGVVAWASETSWQVDPAHSTIGFSVRHLGISKVNGHFGEFSGVVAADEQGRLARVEGRVKIDSIDTGVEARDAHLKGPDFFDASRFPEATLKTRSIEIKGSLVTAQVDLTLKGVTKPVTFTGEYLGVRTADFGQGKTLRAGYSLTATINRKDFGLNFNMLAEGTAVVGDQVTLTLDAEIFRAI